MTAKFITKFLFLFICLFAFVSLVIAQEQKPFPIELGLYRGSMKNQEELEKRLTEFADRLSNEPITTLGFIQIDASRKQGEKIKSILAERSELKDRIIFESSQDLRTIFIIKFYLIPQGAAPPFWECGLRPCECPSLSVTGSEIITKTIGIVIFTTDLSDYEDTYTKYKWIISAGKIIEGQGTTTIKVDAQGAKEITATLEVEGLCEECPRTAEFTTKIQ